MEENASRANAHVRGGPTFVFQMQGNRIDGAAFSNCLGMLGDPQNQLVRVRQLCEWRGEDCISRFRRMLWLIPEINNSEFVKHPSSLLQ